MIHVQNLTFKIVKLWMTLLILLRRWYRSLFTHATHYDSVWIHLKEDGTRVPAPRPGFDAYHPFAIEEVTRYREDGRTDMRIALWHRDHTRAPYTHPDLFAHNFPPPWLSLRCDDVEYTSVLAPYLCRGNVITLAFLRTISPTGTWTYLSPTTFEDAEFPSGGITI